ncbi:MAG: hypothetical protein GF341_13520 [candidate division Zixibacteria bacterium]|nr:hypothetical protein [candidate division Zixibacteria bacterium]
MFDPGLWAGFNFLVYGPPGSGKLSFVKGLSAVANPHADICIYDFQTEAAVQQAHVSQLLTALSSTTSDVVHVIRHLHRLRGTALADLMGALSATLSETLADASRASSIRLHATCYDSVRWSATLKEDILAVFPCWVRMTEQCVNQRDLMRFVKHVVGELNRRYGRNVTEVDAEIVEALRHDTGRSLHEMRNLIERVYVSSSGQKLSKAVLQEVI